MCMELWDHQPKRKRIDRLIKVNVKDKSTSTWQMDNTEQYCTEPVFVSRPGSTEEDDASFLMLTYSTSSLPKSSCVEVKIDWEKAAYCNSTEQTDCTFKLVTGLTNTNCTETSLGITADQEDELFAQFTQAFEQEQEYDALGPDPSASVVKQLVGRCGNYALRLKKLNMEYVN
uniref:Uncharacterized protein n=1 Tax=Ditylenchus dipsaci TaxID=166011 RepID=A0A915E9D6_9BILA